MEKMNNSIGIGKSIIDEIMKQFGIEYESLQDTIDSSRGDDDVRVNFILDKKFVLKINTERAVNETRLNEIARLIERYRSIDVYCPKLFKTVTGNYSYHIEIENKSYICYVEEFAPYTICDGDNGVPREEIIEHLGLFASRYSGIDLSDTNSMWSLIDLNPFDTDIDEKQENLNSLVDCLEKLGLNDLAERVVRFNDETRKHIKKHYKLLPRCVYQADLNATNILAENNHFKGLIDFNLYGTEVNINCFLNETNWFPEKEDFKKMSVEEMLQCMDDEQNKNMTIILKHYTLSELEMKLLPYYKRIIDLEQFPNVCELKRYLKDDSLRDKAVQLIEALIK